MRPRKVMNFEQHKIVSKESKFLSVIQRNIHYSLAKNGNTSITVISNVVTAVNYPTNKSIYIIKCYIV